MNRRLALALPLLAAAPAARAAAAQAPAEGWRARALVNAHAAYESPSEVNGWIDYFRDADPVPPYRESVGAGVGGGALLGYRFTRSFELALGMDAARQRGERGGVPRDQTLHQAQLTARLLLPAFGGRPGRLAPLVSLSLLSRRLEERAEGAGVPWPATSALSGRATTVGVGLRRAAGARLAVEALAEVGTSRYGRAAVGGGGAFDKATHTDRSVGTRLSAGVSWYPWAEPPAPPPVAADWSVAPGQFVRARWGDSTVAGSVVAVTATTMTVQIADGNTLHQVAVPFVCVERMDLRRHRQRQSAAILESALQGALVSTTTLVALERLHGLQAPVRPTRLLAISATPGAVAGAVLGIFRSLDRWEPVPLPAQTHVAVPESAPSCEPEEEAGGGGRG